MPLSALTRNAYAASMVSLRVRTCCQMGSNPEADLQQLWHRIVFNILVSNTDDHLRNPAGRARR